MLFTLLNKPLFLQRHHVHNTSCIILFIDCIFHYFVSLQVIPLDITVELQKQIMSELEILYKVSFDSFFCFYLPFFFFSSLSVLSYVRC